MLDDPRLIELLDPEPTPQDRALAEDVADYVTHDQDGETYLCYHSEKDVALFRVAAVRKGIEWAAKRECWDCEAGEAIQQFGTYREWRHLIKVGCDGECETRPCRAARIVAALSAHDAACAERSVAESQPKKEIDATVALANDPDMQTEREGE